MSFSWSRTLGMAGALGVLVLVAACSTETKRQWLTFFFDGVPAEKSKIAGAAGESATGSQTNLPPASLAARQPPTMILHPPYREHQCEACHESQFSQKLRGSVSEICLLCHQSFRTPPKFRHAPVEAGYCLGCHDPHQSAEKFLLARPGQQLCRDCHDESDVGSVAAHAQIGQTACQTCHASHGSDAPHFLKANARPPTSTASSPAP